MGHFVAPASRSRFLVKLIFIDFEIATKACCLLKLLLSSYNTFWKNYSPGNNQFSNHLLDLFSNTFICYWFISFWLVQGVLSINHKIIIFYFYSQKATLQLVCCALFSNDKTKDLDHVSNLNIDLIFLLISVLIFISVNCSFDTWFWNLILNLMFKQFFFIPVDKVTVKFLCQLLKMLCLDPPQR